MLKKSSLLSILLYLSLLSLALGQYSVVFQTSGSKIYLFDILIGFFSVYGILYFFSVERKLRVPKYLILYFAFSFIALLTLLYRIMDYSSEAVLIGSFYLVRYFIYLISIVVLYNMLLSKLISTNRFLTLIFISAFLVSVAGFIQLIVLPDLSILDPSLGWDPHRNRLTSTFFDPNFVGGYLALSITIAFGTLLSGTHKFSRGEVIIFIILPLIALFLTFSRSSWGMIFVVVFTFGVFKYRRLLLLSLIIGFLVYFAVPRVQTRLAGITDPADSASLRIVSWRNTLTIAKDNLLVGVGFNTFRYAQKEYGFFDVGNLGGHGGAGSDSSFLFVLATTGVVGFIVFSIAYFLPLLRELFKTNPLKLTVIALSLGMFVQSQFVNLLFYPQILFVYMGLLALVNYLET